MSFTPKARRTKSRGLKGTSRLPCYVVCICLSTNRYQKYNSVELGDQWCPTKVSLRHVKQVWISSDQTSIHIYDHQGQLRQPAIFLFDVRYSLSYSMHILSLQMRIRRAAARQAATWYIQHTRYSHRPALECATVKSVTKGFLKGPFRNTNDPMVN